MEMVIIRGVIPSFYPIHKDCSTEFLERGKIYPFELSRGKYDSSIEWLSIPLVKWTKIR